VRPLPLSDLAARLWTDYCNEVERAQAPGGRYAKMKACAGRAAEKALRVAGILELFYAPQAATVTELNMRRGIAVAQWYLDESLRIFEGADAADEVSDADAIMSWAIERVRGREPRQFTLHELTQYGPGVLRPKGERAGDIRTRRDAALEYLIGAGSLFVDGASVFYWQNRKRGATIKFTVGAVQ